MWREGRERTPDPTDLEGGEPLAQGVRAGSFHRGSISHLSLILKDDSAGQGGGGTREYARDSSTRWEILCWKEEREVHTNFHRRSGRTDSILVLSR